MQPPWIAIQCTAAVALLFHVDKDIEKTEMLALSPISTEDVTQFHCLL